MLNVFLRGLIYELMMLACNVSRSGRQRKVCFGREPKYATDSQRKTRRAVHETVVNERGKVEH